MPCSVHRHLKGRWRIIAGLCSTAIRRRFLAALKEKVALRPQVFRASDPLPTPHRIATHSIPLLVLVRVHQDLLAPLVSFANTLREPQTPPSDSDEDEEAEGAERQCAEAGPAPGAGQDQPRDDEDHIVALIEAKADVTHPICEALLLLTPALGAFRVLQALAAAKANVNTKGEYGNTVLHLLLKRDRDQRPHHHLGALQALPTLPAAKADANARNDTGERLTPLEYAVADCNSVKGLLPMVELLVEAKAVIYAPSSDGSICSGIAPLSLLLNSAHKLAGALELAAYLLDHGGQAALAHGSLLSRCWSVTTEQRWRCANMSGWLGPSRTRRMPISMIFSCLVCTSSEGVGIEYSPFVWIDSVP